MEILGDNDVTLENKQFAYSAEIGKLLNIDHVCNKSYCGATNEFIFRKTIENLLEIEASGLNPKDVFVIIGWTSICRAELNAINWTMDAAIKGDSKLTNIKPSDIPAFVTSFGAVIDEFSQFGTRFVSPMRQNFFQLNDKTSNFTDHVIDFLVEYVWEDSLEYEKWFVQQEALKSFLNLRGYDFLMFNATGKFNLDGFNSWTKNLMKTFDYKSYIDPINFSMYDWVNEFYPNEIMEAKHPNKKAHQKFAEYLHQYIIENTLITNYEYC